MMLVALWLEVGTALLFSEEESMMEWNVTVEGYCGYQRSAGEPGREVITFCCSKNGSPKPLIKLPLMGTRWPLFEACWSAGYAHLQYCVFEKHKD